MDRLSGSIFAIDTVNNERAVRIEALRLSIEFGSTGSVSADVHNRKVIERAKKYEEYILAGTVPVPDDETKTA